MQYHVLCWTLFSGSATSGIVAIQQGHNYIGIDLSEEYTTKIALPRIKKAEMKKGFGIKSCD